MSMKFYSPPNFGKTQERSNFEINVSNGNENISKFSDFVDVNESNHSGNSKPNTININITQNKLLIIKRNSEQDIVGKEEKRR